LWRNIKHLRRTTEIDNSAIVHNPQTAPLYRGTGDPKPKKSRICQTRNNIINKPPIKTEGKKIFNKSGFPKSLGNLFKILGDVFGGCPSGVLQNPFMERTARKAGAGTLSSKKTKHKSMELDSRVDADAIARKTDA